MYRFTTRSGTAYTVHNGRITREGDPILNGTGPIVGERVRFDRPPTVGERCRVVLLDHPDGPITTSPVVSVDRYCATCDTFGDLFGCNADLAHAKAAANLAAVFLPGPSLDVLLARIHA